METRRQPPPPPVYCIHSFELRARVTFIGLADLDLDLDLDT